MNVPLQKKRQGLLHTMMDKRGKESPYNKIPEIDVQGVRDHIESFPTMESHYCRRDTKRLYLEASLNIKKMHRLYSKHVADMGGSRMIVSLCMYRKIFNTEYNLSFHKPKKDQCQKCRVFENTKEPGDIIKLDHESHIKRKKDIREAKAADKEKALTYPNF